ncbi:uncharacterized protein LOC113239299 [Hyposmocoma kahamanoa]|uniref:uncharacterized protein LOC113239299 n=1 Tax=Hyposmocoma kahamanoa TaxID=1477025 RepID=UPI000E6D93E3|nr:uncharacterized protein LOC113239299 [Hyposmocoma kahamanoa]XP_026332004.1 uncharacterized protein LOC113239299 [Hyposmocoma kahamanoa]
MNSSYEFAYCRFCAEIKPFDDLLDLEENPQDIKDCIERVNLLKIDFVNILSCKLPKVICEPCYNDLYDASLFISKVKEAQIIINDLIDTKSEIESQEHKFDIGEAQSGTGNIEDPDIEKNYIEIGETKIKSEKDPLHIDDNAIEDLTTLVDSSEAREDTVKEEIATCGIIKNYNNSLETLQCIDRNIHDSNDLVDKGLLENITDIGVSNNPCPRLKVRLECILKDNEIQDSVGSNDNNFKPIWSSPKTVDGHEENIAEPVNYFNDISYHVNASNTLKGLLTLSDESTLYSPNSFQRVTHGDIENISENFLPKERQMNNNNNNDDYLKGTLSKAIQNYDQNIFADLNEKDKNADNVVQDNQLHLPDNISWSEYMWLCQHCDTDYKSMRVVREHSKLVHNKCCAFKCIDCPDLFISFISFVEHVRQHRKSLRLYCPFCNEKFSTPEECANHSYNHWVTSKACDRCGELLTNTEELMKHNKQHREAFYLNKYAKTTTPCVPKDESFTWDNYEMACQVRLQVQEIGFFLFKGNCHNLKIGEVSDKETRPPHI